MGPKMGASSLRFDVVVSDMSFSVDEGADVSIDVTVAVTVMVVAGAVVSGVAFSCVATGHSARDGRLKTMAYAIHTKTPPIVTNK